MSDSKVVKAPFVAMSDIRREIKTVDPKDPNIIASVETEDHGSAEMTTEHSETEAAIDDEVIDGSVSNVFEEAKNEADRMIREARELAEQIREQARQEGFDIGYNEGVAQASDEIRQQEAALEAKSLQLDAAYEASIKGLEPELALIIRDLVEGMVGHYAQNDEVILFLIRLALSEITTYGSFIVKVSQEDFEYVMENKWELTDGLSDKINIEIVRDKNLEAKDCIIETDYGIVDASLSLRLENLGKELSLISDSLRRKE